MKNKTLIGAILVISVISIIFLFYYNNLPTGAVVSEKEKITIAQIISPKSALLIIAEKNGYFVEEGLDVNVKKFSAGRLALDALLSKDAQFASVASVPIMSAGFNKIKILVIATIVRTSNDIKVVTRKDNGINNPTDLKNKKIAVFKGTSSDIFAYYFLKANGLTTKDVKITNLRFEEMPIALERGNIDAFVGIEPSVYNGAKILGDKSIVFTNNKIYPNTFNTVVDSDFAKKNQGIIKKFLRALIKADSFIKQNREKSIKIAADDLGMDNQVLAQIWDDYTFNVSLDKSLVSNLEKDAQWALETGVFQNKKIPNYRAMIYEKPLKEIKPTAVTI